MIRVSSLRTSTTQSMRTMRSKREAGEGRTTAFVGVQNTGGGTSAATASGGVGVAATGMEPTTAGFETGGDVRS